MTKAHWSGFAAAEIRFQKGDFGLGHMAIRFRLFDSAGVKTPAAIPNTQLEQWHQSKSGVPGFAYAQTVTGLTAGGIYRVAVEFRWFDANGRVIRDIKRRSGECRELGQLANLAITGLGARAGSAPGTEVYAIDLLNDGTASARMVGMLSCSIAEYRSCLLAYTPCTPGSPPIAVISAGVANAATRSRLLNWITPDPTFMMAVLIAFDVVTVSS